MLLSILISRCNNTVKENQCDGITFFEVSVPVVWFIRSACVAICLDVFHSLRPVEFFSALGRPGLFDGSLT